MFWLRNNIFFNTHFYLKACLPKYNCTRLICYRGAIAALLINVVDLASMLVKHTRKSRHRRLWHIDTETQNRWDMSNWYEPYREKTSRKAKSQSNLISYKDKLEDWDFGWNKLGFYLFVSVNSKGHWSDSACCPAHLWTAYIENCDAHINVE